VVHPSPLRGLVDHGRSVITRNHVKTIISLSCFAILTVASCADDFTRGSTFDSTGAFATAAKAFKPATTKSDLTKFFIIHEDVYPPATAETLESCEIVWEDDTQAIAFALAQPPTVATYWKIGILFYLVRDQEHWHISDILRFDAQNKAAAIKCELTSGEKTPPIVTITETQGRREWTYTASASYTVTGPKITRFDLK